MPVVANFCTVARITLQPIYKMTSDTKPQDDFRQLAATVDFWFSSLVNHGDLPASVLDELVQKIASGLFLTDLHHPAHGDDMRAEKALCSALTASGVLCHRLCVDMPLTSELSPATGSMNLWDGRMPAALFISFHRSRDCVVQVWESLAHPMDAHLVAKSISAATFQAIHLTGSPRC